MKKPAMPSWLSRKRLAALGGAVGVAVLSWAIANGLPIATRSAHTLILGQGSPIRVAVQTDPDLFVPTYPLAGFDYLLPVGVTKPPAIPPYSAQAFGTGLCGPRAAYRADHLIDARHTYLQLYLQGESASSIVSARVQIVSERPPLHTSLLDCTGGATSNEDLVDINLDRPQDVYYVGPVTYQATTRPAPKPFLVSLNSGDYESVLVDAHTDLHDVRWVLDLVIQSGGRQSVQRIDGNGRPFETSSTADITAAYEGGYNGNGDRFVGRWTSSDPAGWKGG
jgi:hypothetical protein